MVLLITLIIILHWPVVFGEETNELALTLQLYKETVVWGEPLLVVVVLTNKSGTPFVTRYDTSEKFSASAPITFDISMGTQTVISRNASTSEGRLLMPPPEALPLFVDKRIFRIQPRESVKARKIIPLVKMKEREAIGFLEPGHYMLRATCSSREVNAETQTYKITILEIEDKDKYRTALELFTPARCLFLDDRKASSSKEDFNAGSALKERFPTLSYAMYLHYRVICNTDDPKDYESGLRKYVSEYPQSPLLDEIFLRLGRIAKSKDYDRLAATYFERIIADFPDSPHRETAEKLLKELPH